MFPLIRPQTPPEIVTTVYPEEAGYLAGHPDVYRLATAGAASCDGRELITLALWVREVSDAMYQEVLQARRARGRRRPDRAPDLELSGEVLVPATFFDRCPGLETFAMIEEPEEPYWAAKIWLTAPLAAMSAYTPGASIMQQGLPGGCGLVRVRAADRRTRPSPRV